MDRYVRIKALNRWGGTKIISFAHSAFCVFLAHDSIRYACENVSKVIAGNKIDLVDRRVVEEAVAKDFADSIGVPLVECSAKSAQGVEDVFLTLIRDSMRKRYVILKLLVIVERGEHVHAV